MAADEKEATRMAVLAGIDMSMVPSDNSFADHLLAFPGDEVARLQAKPRDVAF